MGGVVVREVDLGGSLSLEVGRGALRQEAAAILALADKLGAEFEAAIDMILACPGRVITCGVGKSGHIARKTAGTLSSTGTPSLFLHAAEAVHGDLGMVTAGDVVILYSHSGETDEVVRLFPSIRAQGAKSILVTGRPGSSAGREADLCLNTFVEEEACPNNLAPTTSTTAMLALSDALAVATMDRRGFSKDDFARFHPSGALGKRLLLTVRDVMRAYPDIAHVSASATATDVIRSMTQAAVGAACVVDGEVRLLGLVSESDLRKHLLSHENPLASLASELMNSDPTTIEPDLLAIEAFEVFQNFPVKIGELPVVEDGKVAGLLVLKDLLRSGIL
ncbi:MAG: KpsF/GutQ family sugar-phosphate isomerase [Chlorobia bacterium]|nr:KpsF/GutQ family sugar-phosphate isomerase [Fimbriimonadaceae bacterium]